MDGWGLPWAGGCRCGAVRIVVDAPPLIAAACHCAGCQRMSGGAYSLTLSLPRDGFAVTAGAPVLGGLAAASHPDARGEHMFCPTCMTWMFSRFPEMDWLVNIRPSILDEHAWFVPYVETCRAEGFPWAVTGAARSFAGFPPAEDYEALVEEYRREGARPGRSA